MKRLRNLLQRKPRPLAEEHSLSAVQYGAEWDEYAEQWKPDGTGEIAHIGDEWIGKIAGAANSRAEYEKLIVDNLISPYIKPNDDVLEIGIGGGKTSALLIEHCKSLLCADISAKMIEATQTRFKSDPRVSFVKLDGRSFAGIRPASLDVCFCFDTMVHIEARDIFNYLSQIPALLKGDRICVFHHGNMMSELGWKYFMKEYQANLSGSRSKWVFAVMTDHIMQQFLDHLGYEVIEKNLTLIPRDCVWICRAPAV